MIYLDVIINSCHMIQLVALITNALTDTVADQDLGLGCGFEQSLCDAHMAAAQQTDGQLIY